MPVTVTQAIADIRAVTAHDAPDTSVGDPQITVWIDQELRSLMREVADVARELLSTVSTFTIATIATPTTAKPANFGSVVLLEKLATRYYPIPRADDYNNANALNVAWTENETTLEICPAELSVGSYRLEYVRQPAAGYTSLDLPDGCEKILIQRVAALVCLRFSDDPAPYLRMAQAYRDQIFPVLSKRTGMHARSGLISERRWL